MRERERERESKRLRRFVTTFLLILSLLLQNFLFLVNPVYAASATWNFSTSTDYTYDNTKIEFSSGQAQLKATSNWYNTSWNYRRAITIDNTSNANTLTQYQIKISLSSTNFDFSKPLSDGSDIRVTDSDGTSLIPYYIETYDSVGQTATVWVKLTSIPASSTYTIYMYYGNSSPQLFTIPPTGLFTRPTSAAAAGSAENMVFDDVTNKYYVVVGSGTDGPTVMYSSSSPSGPWTSEGTKINLGSAGEWDDHYSGGSPHLFKSGSTWYIYYYGAKTADGYNYFKIGYATSSSVTGPYTKAASNPVLDVGGVGAFDQYMAFEPYVFQATNGTWYLFYAGDEGGFGNRLEQVGYATASSPDGPWTKYSGNPVITFGTQPASDAKTVADPFVYGPVDGWYYIGYAGGATQANPWNNSMARTKDFVSFEKLGNIYARGVKSEWDSTNAHRGAISKFGNTYYMPYLGFGTGTNWGVATMSALSTSKGYDPFQVLDYYDDFSGSSLDANKWGISNGIAPAGGSQTLSNGILTINSGTGTSRMLGGRREFGAGYMIESRSRHNSADGTVNHAGEIGFGDPDDLSPNIRILDYNNANWVKSTTSTLSPMSQVLDTNWHVHRVWFKSGSEVYYQNDDNAWETLTTSVPTISMQPFLFSYATTGNTTTLDVDYVYVRKYTDPEPINSVSSETTIYDTSNPTIQPTAANSLTFVSLSAFSETATKNGGQIKYQVSNNSGTTWYWYNSGWTATSSGYTEANTASDINSNISSFPVGSGSFLFKAYLHSDRTQLVQLDSIILTYVPDATAPSISLTALSPDPTTDNTPSLTGTATEETGTVSNVQFQMNATSGSWTACTADDGTFDEATEKFTCTTSTLSDGSHTMYVRATDSNSNTTSNANAATDSFTIDITAPTSFDLDSPGDNSYTNSERPSFKWKATTDATVGLSKYVLEIDNPSIGSGQPSGDFTIDSIPTSRTTDYETNKYIIHYENFSDSDSTNNYISVYTKSHSGWGTSENDGKLREGRVSWKVKAVDNAGNERSSSRTLFVDRTSPSAAFTQINSTSYTTNNFSTTDKTPTIFGKITDSLSGGDSSQTQDENGSKVASGPKEVNIKVEKREGLTYRLVTLYKINMDKPYYTCDPDKTIDNSKQKCDKYLPFEYTPKENLDLGTYKITLSGKDKADNISSESSLTLNITTLAQITTAEEKEIIEEGIKELSKEEQKKVKEELEITKPTETLKPNILERAGRGIAKTGQNVIHRAGNLITTIFTGIGNGISFVFNGVGAGLAFIGNAIGIAYNYLANHAPGVTKNILVAVGTNVNNAISETRNGIANLAFSIGEKTDDVSHGVGTAIIKIGYLLVPEPTKISNVTAVALSPMSVRITWETNHPANGKVNWGFEDRIYEFEDQTDKRTSKHEFVLENLKPDTEYHYEVMSQNRNYVYDANRKFKTPAK